MKSNQTPLSVPVTSALTRGEFLHMSTKTLGALALLSAVPSANATPASPSTHAGSPATEPVCDLREFVRWILTEFEPTVRLPGGAGRYARAPGQTTTELYGVADMACNLYTLNELHPSEKERGEWLAAFQEFQNPETGWLREKDPTHDPLHNTAFALAAMQLLDLTPHHPVKMEAKYTDIRAFLETIDWRNEVYSGSHRGAGIGSIYALVPELGTPAWFAEYFRFCDSLFDPNNGLMGRDKPPGGDADQIGGTFHYHFIYSHFNRQMPYPEKRIDTVLGLQQPDGYWHPTNHLWMTLDPMYLMTRTLRQSPHRFADVQECVRRIMRVLVREVYSADGRRQLLAGKMAAHSLTAALSIAAEAQQVLGSHEIITEKPLKLVLDRRPFI
jgi:hypothetical protein